MGQSTEEAAGAAQEGPSRLQAAWAQAPVRRKLLTLVLLPLLGVLPLLGAILLWWGDAALDQVLIAKVRSDLAVARGYFERVGGEVGAVAASVAESQGLARALDRQDDGAREALLGAYRARAGMTFLNWEPAGSPAGAGAAAASPIAPSPLSAQVVVLDPGAWARLAQADRAEVEVPILPTQGARTTERRVEDRAMVLMASAPVRDESGRLRGHIQAGVLLNRNLAFIDRINEIVYPEGALPFGSKGTATLFLDDVRISTNVRLFDAAGPDGDRRAIGTRVSAAVHHAVLDEGRTWLDRAFVVNEWYVSGYEPITDADGRRVGMLYVGFLEQPFRALKIAVLVAIGVVFFAAMIGAAWVSLRAARSVFRPVERMEQTMRLVELGDTDARVGATRSGDELARLAADLDHLLDTIDDKTRALQELNAVLDARVAQRTADLEQAHLQLAQSEKLAVIGQLAAGMAHEINNPIAVIQGNLDLLRHDRRAALAGSATELRLIDQQIERMRLIVSQMLQFARPGDYAGEGESVRIQQVMQDSLVLTEHATRSRHIRVQCTSQTPDLQALINRPALQQVLVNLIVNAAHAMPEGGRLELGCCAQTLDDGSAGVALTVADEGPGLPDSVRDGLFKPFVTHKKDGTGLGLWISRTIVERHGGDLRAANRDGGGAVFTVLLRAAGSDQPRRSKP